MNTDEVFEQNQAQFEKSLRLISNSAHQLPILQLLHVGELGFLATGYDRIITAWDVMDE